MITPSRDRHFRDIRHFTPLPTKAARLGRWLGVLSFAVAAWACNRPDTVEHEPDALEVEAGEAAAPARYVFDPATLRTLHGTVLSVQPFQRMQGTRYGVRVRIDVDGERAYVYLGPQGYLASHGLMLEPGDEVVVTGSVLGEAGQRIIIATEIIDGGRTYVLRDPDGRPQWRGWRGGRANG
jgi:hypothetical protein